MKVMIITSSPNKDGLTAACGNAARFGAEAAGARAVMVDLNQMKIGNCQACGNGWGPCFDKHICQVQDEFQRIHSYLEDFDGFIFVTPVYWGDISESAKAFFDRVRRCEAWKKEATYFQDKPFITVAAAGGSGNGAMSTLVNFERLLGHLKADRFDFISITRKTREYKLKTIIEASKAMVDYFETK